MKLHDAQIRAALGLPVGEMDASIYMQQQRELQREFQLRQLLLQEQFSGQSRLDSMFAEKRLQQLREQLEEHPELQQHYSQMLLHERLQHQDPALFARAQLQHHLAQTQAQLGAASAQQQVAGLILNKADASTKDQHARASAHSLLRNIAAESLSGNAVKKTPTEKRVFAAPDDRHAGNSPAPKKRPRAGTDDTTDSKRKKKDKTARNAASHDVSTALTELGKAAADAANSVLKPPAQDLLDFAGSSQSLSEVPASRGSVVDLLQAADSEEKVAAAADVLTGIKEQDIAAWQESTIQNDAVSENDRARERGEVIELPNFTSVLPQLPEEPELPLPPTPPEKKRRKKHKGLLDNDPSEGASKSKGVEETESATKSTGETQVAATPAVVFPHSIDPWWPSIPEIRKEKKALGEPQDDDNLQDDEGFLEPDMPFRANLPRIKDRFANEVAPGVLEKLQHCRVHQLNVTNKKNNSLPELVHCFQVTELYPKELMVSCSHCGTWRHAACGGHHKQYSIRECVEVPFTAVCDRCHAEEKLLRDYPAAKKRLDRQRNELLRRAMATSATMRQLSFSKHGGSYKWPLGSVSTTHIGGHTRSVHVRQEKAEKQWKEMISKLSKDYGAKTKERVRIRTRELEKLLSSVEDAGTKLASVLCVIELS